MSTYFV